MKNLRSLLVVCFLATVEHALAQGTAFTYQGQLKNNGAPSTGLYDLTFSLYGTNSGGLAIAGPLTNSPTPVTNGLFTVMLDFGNQFDGNSRWLEIAVRTNGGGAFSTLVPRQPLTPTPYAIMAESASNFLGTLPAAQLSGTYSNQVAFNNGADSFDGSFYGQFFGSTFIGGNFVGNFVGSGSSLSDVWHTGGNFGTLPFLNFVGTTDNQPLIFKVNNLEAMRFEPTTDTPNVVGGWSGNYVQAGLPGVTIGGGGTVIGNQPNIVTNNGNYATIAGGYHNTVTNYGGAILGGSVNYSGGNFATIGGGQFQTVLGDYSFMGAGEYNSILDSSSSHSAVVGGYVNVIQPNNFSSFIGAGDFNTIQSNAYGAIIVGGYDSTIQTNADHAIIASGWQNLIQYWAFESVIGGGAENNIGPFAQYAVIGGGNYLTNNGAFATISGGYHNTIQSEDSFMGGGSFNSIQGGFGNAAILGGNNNTIMTNSYCSTLGGGVLNVIGSNAMYATVSGGLGNTASGIGAAIGGGGPYLASSNYSVYYAPNLASGLSSVVPGGAGNKASGDLSFAAGFRAFATNLGTFVWADSQNLPFGSTGSNQFLIRASGGLGINTNNPAGMALNINGPVAATAFSGVFTGDGTAINNVNALTVDGLAATNFWQTTGNVGTSPVNGNFLGTTDYQPLEFRVNGLRALRLEPTGVSTYADGGITNGAPNVIGGSFVNFVAPGVVGATIAGGGATNWSGFPVITNSVSADFGTVGGGFGNTIRSNAVLSAIAGGYANSVLNDADSSFIGGGGYNMILGNKFISVFGVIGGGYDNIIQTNAVNSTIGGGWQNLVASSATAATIPGGYKNLAGGSYSLAAGSFAQATNDGTFVWSDASSATPFSSTTSNQFLVRALNGVGINTNNPQSALHVNGVVTANAFSGIGSSLANVNAASLGGISSSGFWKTTGNAGTMPGPNFIGTTDNQALLIRGSYVGVGRTFAVTGNDYFGVEAPVGSGVFGGMYIDTTNAGARPFYGYSQAGVATAYTYVDGADTNKWKLNVLGDRITVTTAGLVGINTAVPDSTLSVNGTASKSGGGSWSVFSDARLKRNIEPLTGALDRLLKLRPVTFEYKDPQSIHELPGVQIGLIAQEVEKVFPDWVDTAPNGMKRLNVHGFEALTVQALSELRAEKDEKIAALEKENAQMQKQLAAQQAAILRLEKQFAQFAKAAAHAGDGTEAEER
jgi:hypothetical protein